MMRVSAYGTDRPQAATGSAIPVRALIAFVCAYPLLDWISYTHPMAHFNITPWNPQPALAIALLMLYGQRWLPAVTLVIAITEQLIRDTATPWQIDITAALVLGLCYGAMAQALTQHFRISPRLDALRDVLRLIGIVILGSLLTGALYVGTLVAGNAGPAVQFPEALLRFWIGDGVGMLVFLPMTLMLADDARRRQIGTMLLKPETLLQAASIVATLLFIFGQNLAEQVKFFYLLFLPLVWVSVRSGLLGSAVAALLIQTGIIIAVHITGQTPLSVFELQTFLIALTVMGLFLGVTVDEREQAELALRKSQKLAAAGQMAAALTHELSQPLTALANYARAGQLLVIAASPDRSQLEETMNKLVAESRRTADVVRRLRDFLQHGAMRMEQANLVALMENSVSRLQATAAAENTTLRCHVPTGPLPVMMDTLQIEIVLRNLLRNAIEAACENPAEGREVHAGITCESAREVTVSIVDSGRGIRRGQSEQIFEPFETTKASGMGMGLAVSRAIIEAHHGRLWAEDGDKAGILRFTLPLGDIDHE
ncbi:MAG: MASE1 domain-containing protein [Rhodocyclaceae bacterium]|jgi:signal transduction histidine kinase|nr:MASE1 domain-containing protein [Rhodocyclaceae bacterium]